MTVAVAVRKQGKTVLVADSLVNFGGQRFPARDTRLNKIHRIGDSLIARLQLPRPPFEASSRASSPRAGPEADRSR